MLVAQLSDLHVRQKGQLYKSVADSNRMFDDAINHLHTLDRRPDLVLLTGDLVDEGHPDEYSAALELLQRLTIPYLVIPGNHDHRQNFREAFRDHPYLPARGPLHYCIDDYPLRIVALDSCVPDMHYGNIDDAGLEWLQCTLQESRDKPTLVIMHHPPFISGIQYLDKFRYVDASKLEAIIGSFTNIQAVLCGHVHRSIVRRWAGTVVVACPSIATEIALQLTADAEPRSYLGPPACMLHLWNPPHGLVSHTSYIGNYAGPFPFA